MMAVIAKAVATNPAISTPLPIETTYLGIVGARILKLKALSRLIIQTIM